MNLKDGWSTMSEVDKLLAFMKTGRRKAITLAEYICYQEKKGIWNKKRAINLRRELSFSECLDITYIRKQMEEDIMKTETLIKIR